MGSLRNTRAAFDKPAMADQWSRHPRSMSQQWTEVKWRLHFYGPFSPGLSFLLPLELSVWLSCLLSERCSCTEDLSFALLCPYLVLSHCVFSLAYSSTLPGHALPTLPLCSHCFSVPSSLFPATAPVASDFQRLIHFSGGFLILKVR